MTRLQIRHRLHKLVLRLQRWLARDRFDQLREFVYLDEISVRSLLASTGEGGILSERVNEEMRRRRTGSRSSASVPTSAGSVGVQSSAEQEVQTTVAETRSFNLIQSKFTRLYNSDTVEKKLSLEQIPSDGDAEKSFSGLSVDDLGRSDIIELRVNLSANLLFRLYQTIDYFSDAFEDEIGPETEEMLDLIETSLGNSIPVVGRASDYQVVDEGEKIIKRRDQVENDGEESAQDLEIVTLLNLDSLWVDPIQTLFSNDEFVIYCRVEAVDVDRWYPLKVTRAINSLSEETAKELNQQFRLSLEETRNRLSEMQGLTDGASNTAVRWAQDIQQYSESLEQEYNLHISEDEQSELIQEALGEVELDHEDSQTAQRKRVLDAYTDALIEKFDLVSIDPEERQQLRPEVSASGYTVYQTENLDEGSDAFRIEAKTVALYW